MLWFCWFNIIVGDCDETEKFKPCRWRLKELIYKKKIDGGHGMFSSLTVL